MNLPLQFNLSTFQRFQGYANGVNSKKVVRGQRKPIQCIISFFCFCFFFSIFFFFFFDNLYYVAAKGPAFYTDIRSFDFMSQSCNLCPGGHNVQKSGTV